MCFHGSSEESKQHPKGTVASYTIQTFENRLKLFRTIINNYHQLLFSLLHLFRGHGFSAPAPALDASIFRLPGFGAGLRRLRRALDLARVECLVNR